VRFLSTEGSGCRVGHGLVALEFYELDVLVRDDDSGLVNEDEGLRQRVQQPIARLDGAAHAVGVSAREILLRLEHLNSIG